MNLLTSLALLGFVSRNIAMPIVLMQLPEGTDPKKLNGTMFMISGGSDEFVGPPGTNQSMTVVILPTEALNGLDLALPGLSGRRNFIFGPDPTRNGQRFENGFQTKIFQKIDRKGNTTSTSTLDERSNSFDPQDIPFVDDWSNPNSRRDSIETDRSYGSISGDESGEPAPEISSMSPSDATQNRRPVDGAWNVRSSQPGQGTTRREVFEPKGRHKDGDRIKTPKKQVPTPKPSTVDEDTEEKLEPQERQNNNVQPSYGSRRTVWGYPTRGQIPYPSYVSKPYPKERPIQEPSYGSENTCSQCPSIQYPTRGESFYPPANSQETFIELPDAEVYSSQYDSSNTRFVQTFPTDNSDYGSDAQPSYGSNSDMSSSDFSAYGSTGGLFAPSEMSPEILSSQTGSLLEPPSRSRIPALLDIRTNQDPLIASAPSSSPSRNFYPLASLIDGRGQVSQFYYQTRLQDNPRPASSNVQNILERLLSQSNRYTSLSELVEDSGSGDESSFIPIA